MAQDSIQIEYNQDFKPLERLLSGVKRAGDFFVNGTLEIPMPRVEVQGVGVLSFPVPVTQVAALIGQATRAPYGRGEDTILDEAVRKVWQLPADAVALSGKSWAASFGSILKQVLTGLGCQGMTVTPELYKLLVYDRGGFFLAHRDTEKAEGMFATLVIGLPSVHRGGELVIRHAGREVTVDLSRAEISELTYAAFYADCEHEVRPVTEGNRVCLVYNLVQERGAKDNGKALRAPDYEMEMEKAAALLAENLSAPGAPAKLVWLLEHQYTPDGLAFAGLKLADAARVKVLTQAANRAACAAHLGIVHIEESGAAEPDYDSYRPRHRGRYYDDGEEETAEASDDSFEVIEVSDWRHYVSQWRNQNDEPVEFGEIPLAPGELLPAGALDGEKPDEQRVMEASGNEGASFERSYHRAALIIWRQERYAEVLLQTGVAAVLPYLRERIEAAEAKHVPASEKQKVVDLARRVVSAWAETPGGGVYSHSVQTEARGRMVRLLARLGDAPLLEQFIAEAVTRDYDGSENAALVGSAKSLDTNATGRLFSDLMRRHMRVLHGPCVDLLAALASRAKAAHKSESLEALGRIAEAVVSRLDEVGKRQGPDDWMAWQKPETARPVDAEFVTKLLNVLGELEAGRLRESAAKSFASRPAVFDPVTILAPALAAVGQWDAAVVALWEHSIEFLLERSGQPPAPPKDWRQKVNLACTCADCRELQAFALNPLERTHRFSMRKDRRQHLHNQIDHHGLDMTHVTERKGSPQTLVCTKDRRSYERRCEQYRQDIAALQSLAEGAGKVSPEPANALQRIQTACSLARAWSP